MLLSLTWFSLLLCTPFIFFYFFNTFFKYIYFIYLPIYLSIYFMAVLGLRFCARAFSSCGKRGHSSSLCAGLSLSRPLLLRRTGSRHAGSVVVAHGPSCSAARGVFPDQGSNPCPLHWQADSQPLRHQGSPVPLLLISWSSVVNYLHWLFKNFFIFLELTV